MNKHIVESVALVVMCLLFSGVGFLAGLSHAEAAKPRFSVGTCLVGSNQDSWEVNPRKVNQIGLYSYDVSECIFGKCTWSGFDLKIRTNTGQLIALIEELGAGSHPCPQSLASATKRREGLEDRCKP